MDEPTAPVAEIFSGIQGEGVDVGARQAFVRFCGCNRACRYCDTTDALQPTATCLVETRAGSRQFARWANPLTVAQVVEAVAALIAPEGIGCDVSLTGGEPLIHGDFLAALCPRLREADAVVYLETNGTLPDAFEAIADWVDFVAMDIKLASATGEPADWAAHRRFLRACPAIATQVKVVVTSETTSDELRRVAELVDSEAEMADVVLQPVTPVADARPPSPTRLLAMQEQLLESLMDVRVIPQVHKLMGQK